VDIDTPVTGPDYKMRAEAVAKQHAMEASNRAKTNQNQMMARHARSNSIPSANSSIARALSECTRVVLGISPSSGTLPDPPSQAEREKFSQQKPSTKASTLQANFKSHLAKSQPSASSSRPVHPSDLAFIQKTTLKTLSHALPKATYSTRAPHDEAPSLNYSSHWINLCRSSMQKRGISRCTMDWDDGPQSAWNMAVIQQLCLAWKACDDAGGKASFGIDQSDNNPAVCQELVVRWFRGRKATWKKQTKQPGGVGGAGGSSKRKGRDRAKLKVSVAML